MALSNEREENINIADDVDTAADLPSESACIPKHRISIRERNILCIRRRRDFPIRIKRHYVSTLVVFLVWPDHYRKYAIARRIPAEKVQAQAKQNNYGSLSWYNIREDRTIDMKHTDVCRPMFYMCYFTDTQWTLVYKNELRKEEKKRRQRFNVFY